MKQGHEFVEAVDGREALDRLAEGPIDVVLLDIVMPEMDGYATLQAIKADPHLGRIPVIIISGVDDVASVVRCIEMGATDYLPKPFQPAILQARLDASLAAKRLRDLELEYLGAGVAGDRCRGHPRGWRRRSQGACVCGGAR